MEKLSAHMTSHLVTISMNRPMRDAEAIMDEHRIRHLPVTDEDGLVVGILSSRDLALAMDPEHPGFNSTCIVGDFMSWPALTVSENMKIVEVAEGMIDEKVSSFLVTGKNREVVGIVTSEDMLQLLAKMLRDEEKKKDLSAVDKVSYSPLVREAMQELQALGV